MSEARTLRGRIRRWLRPPRTLRPTRAGWLFFALTLGVGFAALNTGNNLLYLVFSYLLGFLVLSGVLSEAVLRRVAVRRLVPREAFAEGAAPVVIEVENRQRRIASFAIVVEDLAGENVHRSTGLGRAFFLRVGPGARERRAYTLHPKTRGPLAFAGFRVSTRFPFGLFLKSLWIEAPGELLVYPAVDPVRASPPSAATGRAGDARSRTQGRGTEAAGLREYARGDSARSVHWRASVRRAQLLVRDREREDQSEYRALLRTRGATSGEAFEAAVRRTASEVVAHLDAGFRVSLATDAELIPAGEDFRHRARLLALLARVSPELPSERAIRAASETAGERAIRAASERAGKRTGRAPSDRPSERAA